MIVVLDANALVSGSIARAGSTLAAIIDAWKREAFDVAISDHIFAEVRRALAEPYFTSRLTAQEIADFFELIRTTAVFVSITVTVHGVATHPEDDLVLATAVSAGADYLVTGDTRLRNRVQRYQGIEVISPRELLAILSGQASDST